MIEQAIDDLEKDEGWREEPYRDHLGNLTIGFGFLIDERKPVKLPWVVGKFWLRHLVQERALELAQRWPAYSGQPDDVRRALVNMAYQLGVSGLLGFKNMLGALERGDRKEAARHALDSEWASERQTPERARRVTSLIRGDV